MKLTISLKLNALFIMKKTGLMLLNRTTSVKENFQTPAAYHSLSKKEWPISVHEDLITDFIWRSSKSLVIRKRLLNQVLINAFLDIRRKDIIATSQSNYSSITSISAIKMQVLIKQT